jgi:hypothetical protein
MYPPTKSSVHFDDAFLGLCVLWKMSPLDDASPYDPSIIGGGGKRYVGIGWVKTVGLGTAIMMFF